MAFRDLMNNYFYGKQGKADYTVADMPQNRRQLFGEVLKVRWSGLFGVNLLYSIAWLPAIIWTFMNYLAMLGTLNGELELAEAAQEVRGLFSTYLLILAPCIAITGPFNAGATYVLRNWARDQHSFVLSDFKDAVKANWKQALAISTISGLLPTIVWTAWSFYSGMTSEAFIFFVPAGLVLLVGVVWFLSSTIMMDMLITYDLKLKDVIRNSILLTIGKLPFAALIRLIMLALPILGFLLMMLVPASQGYVIPVTILLFAVFMTAFNKLIAVSYGNWLCETYINPRIEGAATNIGLRPDDWDDVTFLPDDDK